MADDDEADFPHLRVRGPVAIINLSSAVPTPIHLAQGTLGAGQIERTARLLGETGARGLDRVVWCTIPSEPEWCRGASR